MVVLACETGVHNSPATATHLDCATSVQVITVPAQRSEHFQASWKIFASEKVYFCKAPLDQSRMEQDWIKRCDSYTSAACNHHTGYKVIGFLTFEQLN